MISIIVPCRNEVTRIRAFIESVLSQNLGALEWELIIADGLSDDGTREAIEAYCQRHAQKVRMIDNPGRIVSTGLNAAVRAASGDLLLRMDCHTEYHPDYVARCVQVLEQTGADNVGGPARTRYDGFFTRALCAAYHNPFSCGGSRFHDETYEGPVDTVTYGCWRRETLERLGMFDESLVRNQDDELNFRIVRAGGTVWQSSSIVSWYRPRSSLSGLCRQYLQYGFWKVAVIRKHGTPASWRHLAPGAFVLANLILAATAGVAFVAGLGSLASFAARAWSLLLTVYGVCCIAYSLRSAKHYGWPVVPLLPALFTAYHLSYGSGFLLGVVSPRPRLGVQACKSAVFSGMTR
jgi:glycosyltransferase involved in cell wall biosynthesis